MIFNVKSHVLPGQYIREYPAATLENQEDALQLHINQYTPKDESSSQPGAITIIAAHANGFPKVGLICTDRRTLGLMLSKYPRNYTNPCGKNYISD